MAQTSRLVLEIDSRDAEQKATDVRKALEAVEDAGLSIKPAMDKAGSGLESVGKSATKATKSIHEERDEIEQLLGSIDPLTKKLNELEKQEASLNKARKSGKIDLDTYNDYSAKLTSTRAELSRFSETMGKTGVSAKQAAAALRGVPDQFTDIAVSLQAGQAPLTVFLQQGGQLKDMFGGAAPAAKALGGYILGLINPFTVAAAAVGTLGLAYYQGSKEADAYRLALVTTGNSAGTTSASLAEMAKRVSDTVGTTGEAASALAQLAAGGNIASDSFTKIATAALSFENATGKAVSDTIAEFVKIQDDPVKAIAALNEKYNFLTAAVYEQVRALQEQGDKQGAATVAEDAYAKALQARSEAMTANLGTIELAWNGIKSAAKESWDAMLGVGRGDSLDAQIANTQKLLDDRKNSWLSSVFSDDLGSDSQSTKFLEQKLKILQAQRDTLVEQGKAEGENARIQREGLSAYEGFQKSVEANFTKTQKMNKALEDEQQRIDKARAAGYTITAEQEEAAYKAIRENSIYKEAAAKKVKAYTEDAGIKELDQAKQQYAVLQQQSTLIGVQKGDVDKLGASAQALTKWEQELADIKEKKTLTADQKSLLANQELITAQLKRNAALEKENALRKIATDESQKLLAFTQSINDKLELSQEGLSNQLAGVGLGSEGRKRLQDDLKIRQDYQKDMDKLQEQLNKGDISQGLYEKETSALKSALDQRLGMQQDYYQKLDAAQADWTNGANSALQDYIDETQNIAGQTYTLFSDSLHGVEDAFVDAATTGKLSFKDLADSIIADLARIVAKAYVVTPILAALGIGGDSASGAGSAGGLGSIFGGGSGGGIGGALSSIKDVVSVAGSKFGQSVMQGWSSGEGVAGGLQGAFENGAGYVKDAITSAFTSGSASAAATFTSETASAALTQSYANYAAQFGTGVSQGSYTAASTAVSQSALSSSLANLSVALSYIQGVYTIFQSFQDYGLKGAAVTGGAAAAGAMIGSYIMPGIGTAIGFALGAVAGAFGANAWFGSGEKYPDLSTSATGRYVNGQYSDTGIAQNWQRDAPKYGSGADAQMSSTLQQFSSTLGNLYEVLGNGADVVAYNTLQQRKTSGKYSSTFGAQLDDGSVITGKQQFKADDISAALTADYDDIMGTFLAKAIVSSKSLPDYFRSQFTEFANDWDTTADEVIKAIEGVFTRFNGVNDALSLINVNNLKLDNTGLMASDSILNMIGAMSDLDTTTATAKEKVDALNTAVGTYYQAFFSADEQFADLTKSLEGAFGNFGLELPDTRSAYRDMVEDIDVTTAAGQAMFATLVGLAQNADSYYGHLEDTAKSAADAAAQAASDAQQAALDAAQKMSDALMQGANDAYSTLQRSITAQQKTATDAYNARAALLNDMLSTANTSVSDLTSVSNSLENALKSLRGTSDDAVTTLRSQAQATLQSALATAKAGGSLANFNGLDDALDTVSSNTTDLYSSLEDFNRDQGRTANVVSELNVLNGKQLTSAEKSVKALQDQLDQAKDQYDLQMSQYDAQLAFGQSQLDALNGVDNSILGVTSAINAMNAAVVAALQGQVKGAGAANTSGNNATLVSSLYKTVLGRDADAAGASYWGSKLQSGQVSYQDAATQIAKEALALDASKYTGTVSQAQIAASKAAALAYLHSNNVPGYASGGNFGGGIRLVGEKGPEIELTGPSKILNASQTAKALSSANSSGGSSDLAERQAWTNKLLNQVLNAINRQTTQGVPALPVT